MKTITYDDARRFREISGAPLTWEIDAPPLPRDRIEFTRLILQAAEDTGVALPLWQMSIPFDSSKQYVQKWVLFQETIHGYTGRQIFYGLPTVRYSEWENCIHYSGTRTLEWGEYIERLESDYYEPWRKAWQFGSCEGSEERIFTQLKKQAASIPIAFSVDTMFSKECKYPHALELTGDEILSDYMSAEDGDKLEQSVKRDMGVRVQLVEVLWLGTRAKWLEYTPLALGAVLLTFAILGVVRQHYSGWWLFLFVPATVAFYLLLLITVCSGYSPHWRNKILTFDDLAKRIAAMNQQRWHELQRLYQAE